MPVGRRAQLRASRCPARARSRSNCALSRLRFLPTGRLRAAVASDVTFACELCSFCSASRKGQLRLFVSRAAKPGRACSRSSFARSTLYFAFISAVAFCSCGDPLLRLRLLDLARRPASAPTASPASSLLQRGRVELDDDVARLDQRRRSSRA